VAVLGSRRRPVLAFAPTELGFRDAEHAGQLGMPCGCTVAVHAVLTTQGITEEQNLANLFRTNTAEQAALNARCVEQLALYHERRLSRMPPAAAPVPSRATAAEDGADAAALLARARTLLRTAADGKNVDLLHTVSALTRRLGGGRLTLCANGSDRTSMALTLEHGELLQMHGLDGAAAAAAVATMRRAGVRRENAARAHGGGRTFGFNVLQTQMLPEAYRPPHGSSS
jgi:hypothetical protein